MLLILRHKLLTTTPLPKGALPLKKMGEMPIVIGIWGAWVAAAAQLSPVCGCTCACTATSIIGAF